MPIAGGRIELGGFKLSNIPTWVVAVLALGAGLVAAWMVIGQPAQQLITAQAANAALQMEMSEYGRHIAETPESQAVLMDDARGHIGVMLYRDGCALLTFAALLYLYFGDFQIPVAIFIPNKFVDG